MDAGFNKNEAEFGVFVFSVALEMLADSNSLSLINYCLHGGHMEIGSNQPS